jgi:hypothetical protein
MTVAELNARMSPRELMRWRAFYEMFPFDDFHRFHRPAALISRPQDGRVAQLLDWLQPDPMLAGFSEADVNTIRALGFGR